MDPVDETFPIPAPDQGSLGREVGPEREEGPLHKSVELPIPLKLPMSLRAIGRQESDVNGHATEVAAFQRPGFTLTNKPFLFGPIPQTIGDSKHIGPITEKDTIARSRNQEGCGQHRVNQLKIAKIIIAHHRVVSFT